MSKRSRNQRAIDGLRAMSRTLSSTEFLWELRRITRREAIELRGAILRIFAFLDDSISNPYLGSIFDRQGRTPLNAMLANIAKAYGVRESVAGTTGTTGLNVPAVMTLAAEGECIAVARDCHVSVIGGLCLSGATPVYLVPPFDAERGVLLPLTRGEVATALDAHPGVRSVVLTMPTYHGLMGDCAGIVEECHQRKVLVMVDGAHGPHFHFLRRLGFPAPAEDAGADIVTQSTHKVLSALSQGSLMHFNNPSLLPRYQEYQSMGFQSTSFSYPILVSIEHAIDQMLTDGERTWARAVRSANRLRAGASRLRGVRVLDQGSIDGQRVVGLDPTRVTLNVRSSGLSAYEVAERLVQQGLVVEMATHEVLLFLVGPSVTEAIVDRTLAVLEDVLSDASHGAPGNDLFPAPPAPTRVMTPRQSSLSARERVTPDRAVGRVSGETISCYPPGQAILVAGERITQEIVDYLAGVLRAGGHLKRAHDDHFQTVEVVRQ
jgi:arginine decarboxylase